jgi:3-hydroxyacyl-CoA dehydrogenase/enoyl-CoA hydratase/3-hydroxybutyryl-CoA epimerase
MAFFQSKNLWVEHLDDDVAGLVLDTQGSKTNLLTPTVVDEIGEALERVATDGRFAVLVMRSAKAASFCNGIDLQWLAGHVSADELVTLALLGQKLCELLAELPIPSVAVIGGACLGPGLQLALACDYRVVVKRPATVLGFNEVELGLIPCWGGTQRLPRLVGLQNSLKLLATARRVRPSEALALGLADALSTEEDATPPDFLAAPAKRDWTQFPRRTWRQRFVESLALGRRLILRGARRVLSERLPDDMPAPWEALDALRIATESRDLTPGLDFERAAVARLAAHPAFHNLLHLRLERDCRRAQAPKPESVRYVRSIGVVGATPAGIALVEQALLRGCQVVLHDIDKTALGYASLALHRTLLQDEVKHGNLSAPAALKCLSAFRGTASWEHFDELDLVLDTVEDGRRRERIQHLDGIATPATILASTGAADTATSLRQGLQHPRRVAVLYFAGPPGHETLAELAHADDAAEPMLKRLEEWVAAQGKFCVRVADRPGLLTMRVWLPAFNEAALLLREGMRLERVDEAMDRFGMAVGPLELMDRLGLDAVLRLAAQLQPILADRITLEVGFTEMVRQQMLGARAGAGFYRYAGRQRRPNPRAIALWTSDPGDAWLARASLSRADQLGLAQLRMTSLMVIEAYHCLCEHIVPDAATLDFALTTAGWAPHRGGPWTFACQLGADAFIARLQELACDFGSRFSPPAGLRDALREQPPTEPAIPAT